MTSTPRFFARLAPWATQQEGAVHAAVLPRFAPRDAEQASELESPRRLPSIVSTDETVPRRTDSQPHDASMREAVDRVVVTEERRTGAPMSANKPLATSPVVVSVATPVNTRADTPRVTHASPARATAAEREPTHSTHSTTIVDHAAAIETYPEHEQPTARADADLPAMVAHGPLRPHAVAQRSAPPRAEAPTIVEITIDRIDVRVPASSTPTRQTTTRAAPTQSLAEYLQQRGKGGA